MSGKLKNSKKSKKKKEEEEVEEEEEEEMENEEEEEEIEVEKKNKKNLSKKEEEKTKKESKKETKKEKIEKNKKNDKKTKSKKLSKVEEQEKEGQNEDENNEEEKPKNKKITKTPEEEIEENDTVETSKKTKKQKNKYHINQNFEKEIVSVYKLLKTSGGEEEEEEDEEEKEDSMEKNKMIICESKLREALKICKEDQNLMINKNIVDKLNKISKNNKMNLNYIIGKIYISLMSKENLFDYDSDQFDSNDMNLFLEQIISFKDTMKNTSIQIYYDRTLVEYLSLVLEEFELEDEIMKKINNILDKYQEEDHSNLGKDGITELVAALKQTLEIQPNIYEQYQIFLQNKSTIIKIIDKFKEDKGKSKLDEFIKLGKYLAYLFFNKGFTLYTKKDKKDSKEEFEGEIFYLFDGKEDKTQLSMLNSEDFFFDINDFIMELRESLAEIIFKFIKKFIELSDNYQIQYLVHIIARRLYFAKMKKYEKKIIPFLAESLVNLCFFKQAPLKFMKMFINKILNSKKEEDLELKNCLIEKIKEVKDDENFLYKDVQIQKEKDGDEKKTEKKPKKSKKTEGGDEDYFDDDEEDEEGFRLIENETLLLYGSDVNFGCLNYLTVKSGQKFIIYEEIQNEYSVLDFYFDLEELDVNVTVTDVTEGREIFSQEKLESESNTPLKLVMFYTKPRILKFEFDNSYSWLKSKIIKYKINIFYPKNTYSFTSQLTNTEYMNSIVQNVKKSKKNQNILPDEGDNLLIVKFDGKNKVYNCTNVCQNLETIKKLEVMKISSISSIFIKLKDNNKGDNEENKSYFYYYKEQEGLIENELTKDKFEKYLYELTSQLDKKIDIINFYIINGDSNLINCTSSIKKIVGFEPVVKVDGFNKKILFYIQSLNQSQLLYYLFTQVKEQEPIDIILLINYTKYDGYQIILYNNYEIIKELPQFNGLNKSATVEENIKVIYSGIEKLDLEDRKLDIILTRSIDSKETDVTGEVIEEKLNELLKKNEEMKNCIRIVKTDEEFNKNCFDCSHVFYLSD